MLTNAFIFFNQCQHLTEIANTLKLWLRSSLEADRFTHTHEHKQLKKLPETCQCFTLPTPLM